jgi:hypothetical protein
VAEAAAWAGVSVPKLLAELGLPADTSPTRTLDECRPRGYPMREMRARIARLRDQAKEPE